MSLVTSEIRQPRPLARVSKLEGVHALGFVEHTFAILGEAMMRFLSMMEKRLPIQRAAPAELTHGGASILQVACPGAPRGPAATTAKCGGDGDSTVVVEEVGTGHLRQGP